MIDKPTELSSENSTPVEAAFHIELELQKLMKLAEKHEFDMLVYLIDHAKIEAQDIIQEICKE